MTGELGIKKFCVVCSEEDEGDKGGGDGNSLLGHRHFSRFCGELEMCTGCVVEEVGKESFEAFNFLEGLEEQKDKVFVCSECLKVVEEAMERREQLEGKEVQVLKLQVELLERLKELEECTSGYYKEMEGILGRVRGAEVDQEEETLLIVGDNLCGKRCDVLRFRERIFDVVTYLGMFQEDVNEKLVRRPGNPPKSSFAEEEDNFLGASNSFPPSPMEIDEGEVEEFLGSTSEEPLVKTENLNKSDHEIEDNELPVKRRSLRKKKVIQRSWLEEDDDEDQDPSFQDPAASSDEEMMPPKKTSGTNKIKSKTHCKCPQCGKRFSNKYHLDGHIKRIHKKEFTLFCEVCGKGDDNRWLMKFHQTRVHGMCSVKDCNFSLAGDRLGLRNHQVTAHGKEIDVLTCPECSKLYVGWSDLRRHLRELHGKTEADVQQNGMEDVDHPSEASGEEVKASRKRSGRNKPKTRRGKKAARILNNILTQSQQTRLTNALSQVNMDDMSTLKRKLVEAIIKRNTLFPPPAEFDLTSGSPHLEKLTPLDMWTYDPTNDHVTLAGVKIVVVEDPKSPSRLDLQCSDCAFPANCLLDDKITNGVANERFYNMQQKMFNHVLGPKHLKMFKCLSCDRETSSLRAWRGHKAVHDNPDSGTCSICGERFTCLNSLQKHKVRHVLPTRRKLTEALSQVNFDAMGPLKKWLVSKIVRDSTLSPGLSLSAGTYLPDNISSVDLWTYNPTSDEITIAGFQIGVTEDDPNTLSLHCTNCGHQDSSSQEKIYDLQQRMFSHILGPKHLNTFLCRLCDYQGNSLKLWREHKSVHAAAPNDPEICTICGKQFKLLKTLREHQTNFHGISYSKKVYQCSTCGKIASNRSNLLDHEDTHKSLEERAQIVCPFCGLRMLKTAFQGHKKTICPVLMKTKPKLLCPHCGQGFQLNCKLQMHMRVKHGGEKGDGERTQCDICGGSFKYLRQHKRHVHGLDKDKETFPCGKGCGKQFYAKGNLHKHEAHCQGQTIK